MNTATDQIRPDAAPAQLDVLLQQTLPGARVRLQSLPDVPALQLWLIDPEQLRGPLPHDVAAAVMARPAYWAFCWASGQALAARLLADPALVAGRTVLDFGCGSGVAGIAAARAGAARVIACDSDPQALAAAACNAHSNGVELEYCDDAWRAPAADLVLVADVLYDPANLPLLEDLLAAWPEVLLADSRIAPERVPELEIIGESRCVTWPDLGEADEFGRVRFYRPRRAR